MGGVVNDRAIFTLRFVETQPCDHRRWRKERKRRKKKRKGKKRKGKQRRREGRRWLRETRKKGRRWRRRKDAKKRKRRKRRKGKKRRRGRREKRKRKVSKDNCHPRRRPQPHVNILSTSNCARGKMQRNKKRTRWITRTQWQESN